VEYVTDLRRGYVEDGLLSVKTLMLRELIVTACFEGESLYLSKEAIAWYMPMTAKLHCDIPRKIVLSSILSPTRRPGVCDPSLSSFSSHHA
jgi:hypothetical protein